MLIERSALRASIATALERSRGVVLVGTRQVGKTTLARTFVDAAPANYFDLEDPRVEAQFAAPMTLLEGLRGLVAIDGVQRAPELFKVLRVLIDRPAAPARFLLLGSASPGLIPWMRIAIPDLRLDALYVVYPGDRRYALAEGIEAVPLTDLAPGN